MYIVEKGVVIMRGIKECVNWMMDNPNEELSDGKMTCKFDGTAIL